MSHVRPVLAGALTAFIFAIVQGCVHEPPERLLQEHDIAALTVLANHYTHQAETLREEAKHWEAMAEYYERHPEFERNGKPGKHAGICREVAKYLRKAAEHAEAFAKEHDALASEGQGKGIRGQVK